MSDTSKEAVEWLAADLIDAADGVGPMSPRDMRTTAATLRAMRAERDAMREALRETIAACTDARGNWIGTHFLDVRLLLTALDNARAALAKAKGAA